MQVAALGLQDAVNETELRRQQGHQQPGDILALAGRAADWACGSLAWLGSRARRFRTEGQRREDALPMLARVIKSTESSAWSSELLERIREAAREDTAGNALREVLHRHGDLRLRQSRDRSARLHDGWRCAPSCYLLIGVGATRTIE